MFALLEMHKRGEATWDQSETFGPISIKPRIEPRPGSASPQRRSHETHRSSSA